MLYEDVPSSMPRPDRLPSKSAASVSSMSSKCHCTDVVMFEVSKEGVLYKEER